MASNSSKEAEELEDKLRKIALSASESDVIELGDDDIKASAGECTKSLFGKIIGEKKTSLVGKVFKKIKNVAVVKAGGVIGSYLRLLVAVDVNEPLPCCVNMKLHNQQVMATFHYEKLVSLCYSCGRLGHLDKNCQTRARATDIEKGELKEGNYGEWMKALASRQNTGSNTTNTLGAKESENNNKNMMELVEDYTPLNPPDDTSNKKSSPGTLIKPICKDQVEEGLIINQSASKEVLASPMPMIPTGTSLAFSGSQNASKQRSWKRMPTQAEKA
ncbi:Unknown protein [Striga hermonthica]|uniref:CCHC-type domain-containing protein n=1 Tax=Striga hermonthica TaxID=68872 RepID=A0A9N7RQC6_STRHE|nr:Unknown protein [Striga hermonthica]